MSRKKTYMMDRLAGSGSLSIDAVFSDQTQDEIRKLLHKVPAEIVDAFINDLEVSCSVYTDITCNPAPDKSRIIDELKYFNTTANQLIDHISKWHIQSEEFLHSNYLLKYKRVPPLRYVSAELKMMTFAVDRALADLKGSAGNKYNREVFLGDNLQELFKTHLNEYYEVSRSRDAMFPRILDILLREVGSDKNPYDIAKAAKKKAAKKKAAKKKAD